MIYFCSFLEFFQYKKVTKYVNKDRFKLINKYIYFLIYFLFNNKCHFYNDR